MTNYWTIKRKYKPMILDEIRNGGLKLDSLDPSFDGRVILIKTEIGNVNSKVLIWGKFDTDAVVDYMIKVIYENWNTPYSEEYRKRNIV